MTPNGRTIGFILSGLLHLGVFAAVINPGPAVQSATEEAPLAISLDMFRTIAAEPPAPLPAPLSEAPPPAEEPPVAEEPPLAEEPPPPEPVAEAPPPPPEPVEALPPPPPQTVAKADVPRPVKAERRPPPKPRRAEPVPPPAPVVASAPPPPVAPPVAPTIAMAAPAVAPPRIEAIRSAYLAALAEQIHRHKFYPRASRRFNEQGTVVVRFVIEKDGRLRELSVAESSGIERLDTAALETLRKVTPFEPIPDVLGRDEWPISVPIAFTLQR